jgi:hypothetical protein
MEEVTDSHDLVNGDILRMGWMENQAVPVPCHLQVAIRFRFNFAHLAEQRVHVTPFQIMGNRMLENSVIDAEVGAGEWGDRVHSLIGGADD